MDGGSNVELRLLRMSMAVLGTSITSPFRANNWRIIDVDGIENSSLLIDLEVAKDFWVIRMVP
jgi:hypothetical protein